MVLISASNRNSDRKSISRPKYVEQVAWDWSILKTIKIAVKRMHKGKERRQGCRHVTELNRITAFSRPNRSDTLWLELQDGGFVRHLSICRSSYDICESKGFNRLTNVTMMMMMMMLSAASYNNQLAKYLCIRVNFANNTLCISTCWLLMQTTVGHAHQNDKRQ